MSQAGTIYGDLIVTGQLVAKSIPLPTGTVTDDSIEAGAKIDPAKLGHRNTQGYELFESATAIVPLTRVLRSIRGTTGKLLGVIVWIEVQATGGDRTVHVDLQLSTGGGAYATVLTATIAIDNTTVIRTDVAGTLTGGEVDLVQGDKLRAVVTVAGGAGNQAKGLGLTLVTDEDAV